jgi:hypothetical protein
MQTIEQATAAALTELVNGASRALIWKVGDGFEVHTKNPPSFEGHYALAEIMPGAFALAVREKTLGSVRIGTSDSYVRYAVVIKA